jgi:hypothetical protein
MTKTFTPEQKRQYFTGLREQWKARKALADQDQDARARYNAIMAEAKQGFSYYSFYFTLCDMKAQGLDGNPYIDCKTFNGWRASGFKVKKGEKSKVSGIVWIAPITKDKQTGEDVESDYVYPKVYHLFHRTQVEAL